MQKKPTTPRTAAKASKTRVGTTVAPEASRAEVTQALSNGKTNLSAAEEKALRMRFGVGAPKTLVLERVGQDNPESREKLLGIELELLRQWRQRQQTETKRPEPRAAITTVEAAPANPRRDRIIAALKTKKPAK